MKNIIKIIIFISIISLSFACRSGGQVPEETVIKVITPTPIPVECKNEMYPSDAPQFGDNNSVDYPDYAKKVARNVISKKSNVGILVCGSGTGMAISANKFKKIRAAVCYNIASTRLSRMHNNANILALGSRLTNKQNAIKLVNVFLSTKFEGGRHLRRVKKI